MKNQAIWSHIFRGSSHENLDSTLRLRYLDVTRVLELKPTETSLAAFSKFLTELESELHIIILQINNSSTNDTKQ